MTSQFKRIIQNKKNRGQLILLTLLIGTLALGGCAAGGTSAEATNGTTTQESTEKATTQNGASTTGTDQTKKENNRADLMGEVKSIVGNSVTLALAKVPTRTTDSSSAQGGAPPEGGGTPPSGGGAPPEGAGNASGGNAKSSSSGSSNSTKSQGSSTGSAGGPPSGGPEGGAGMGGSGGTGNRRAMNVTLTGETKEIMIPVGISITSGMGNNAKTVDIADIEKGDVLMIYYVEGTEDIEKITIR